MQTLNYFRNIIYFIFFVFIIGLINSTILLPAFAADESKTTSDSQNLNNQDSDSISLKNQAVINSMLKRAPSNSDNQQFQRMSRLNSNNGNSKNTPNNKRMQQNTTPSNVIGPPMEMPVLNENEVGLGEQAFSNMVRNMMPLSPEQIKTLRYLFDQTQRAVATEPGPPPKPTSTSVVVNLTPGATPPIIRLSGGFISSLVFLDSTGASWPIESYDLGNPKSFNIQWNKKDNNLLVQALGHYRTANLAVKLRKLSVPIMITLIPGQHHIDYRVDLHIPREGPDARIDGDSSPSVEHPALLNVLNGIAPMGSKILNIKGGRAQAWLLDNRIFLRTRNKLLSPAWISTMSSADGTNAYELPFASVIIALQKGKLIHLEVENL